MLKYLVLIIVAALVYTALCFMWNDIKEGLTNLQSSRNSNEACLECW
jgi:hypothetical protein